jgi:Cu2+-exporting ATPase
MLNQTQETSGRNRSSVTEVDLKNAYEASEYANLENYMSKLRGIQGVHLDRTRGVAHLTYDSSVTTAEAIESDLRGCGYNCECQSCGVSKCQPGHPPVGTRDEAGPVSVTAKSLEH